MCVYPDPAYVPKPMNVTDDLILSLYFCVAFGRLFIQHDNCSMGYVSGYDAHTMILTLAFHYHENEGRKESFVVGWG